MNLDMNSKFRYQKIKEDSSALKDCGNIRIAFIEVLHTKNKKTRYPYRNEINARGSLLRIGRTFLRIGRIFRYRIRFFFMDADSHGQVSS
jgi:hypothetical protein